MPQLMDEKDLIRILKDEETDAASYYTSELADAQATAMKRYNAEPYGDEAEGRSKVVTHDIEDTINWIMPHLMRTFRESDELVTCDDSALDDGDPSLKQASDYLHHVLWKDNDGETAVHDFTFDGLLQKMGVARCYWEDPKPKMKTLEGVTIEQLTKYVQDEEYEILEASQEQKTIEGQPYECFDLRVKHTPKCGRAKVEGVPPEQFRISRRAKSIKDADYHGWQEQVFLAEVVRDHPKKARALDPDGQYTSAADDDTDIASDARADARFPDEPTSSATGEQSGSSTNHQLGRKKVRRDVEYLRCDYDGDGVIELRRICRVGDVILENDEAEESEFVAWSPIRVAHRLVGRSLADTLIDLQKIRTVLTRAMLDGQSRSLMPRTAINEQQIASDGSTVERLLDHDVGAVIPVKGDVRTAVAELVTPDVTASALTSIEYFDRKAEEASGVNKHAQGISPEAITKTASGIEMLQAAANSRVEQVARWCGKGLEEIFAKLLRLLVRHQDGPRMVKINGKRMEIDPRRWGDEMTVSVHVGMAAESREKKLMNLNLIATKQEAIIVQAGPSNPVVSIQEYRNTLAMMAETMGFKSPARFFKEIPEGYQPPPPGPDPKMAEVQGKLQLAQAEQQAKAEQAQAQFQLDTQKAQADIQLQREKAAADIQAMREKAAGEIQLAREKAQAEIVLARETATAEMELERERIASQERVNVHKADQDARMSKNREGGRLDA